MFIVNHDSKTIMNNIRLYGSVSLGKLANRWYEMCQWIQPFRSISVSWKNQKRQTILWQRADYDVIFVLFTFLFDSHSCVSCLFVIAAFSFIFQFAVTWKNQKRQTIFCQRAICDVIFVRFVLLFGSHSCVFCLFVIACCFALLCLFPFLVNLSSRQSSFWWRWPRKTKIFFH